VKCSQLFILKAYSQGNCCVLNRKNLTGELSLFLDSSQEDAYPLMENLPGFSLHVPSWQGRLSVNPGEKAAIQIEVMELQGNAQLKEYTIEERGCYFPQEGKSREKCLDECRIKATLINCQCVPYPFELSKENFKHCTLENITCLQSVEGELGSLFSLYTYFKFLNSYTKSQRTGHQLSVPNVCRSAINCAID